MHKIINYFFDIDELDLVKEYKFIVTIGLISLGISIFTILS